MLSGSGVEAEGRGEVSMLERRKRGQYAGGEVMDIIGMRIKLRRKVKKYQPTERHYLDHTEGIREPRPDGWGRSRHSIPPPRKNLVTIKKQSSAPVSSGGRGGVILIPSI